MLWNALNLLLYALLSTAFLAFLGYGLASLLLPRQWREEQGLLAPLLGYLLLLLVGYYSLRTVLDLRGAFWLALTLGLLINSLALRRRRGERLSPNWRRHGPVWLMALLAFLLGALPLMRYGYITVIGENWDPENYLPVAEYLLQVPLGQIGEMPPNPLRDLNASPPRIGLTLGFSILQGSLQQLRGWDALRSFAPTLALLRGLAVLAFYLLFRRGLRMGHRSALLASLLVALYALGLWIALFNFGMQMAALPLVPLALLLWLAVLRRPAASTVLLGAAAVAVLPIAYYPALTVFVPAALGLGLYELIRSQRRRAFLLTGLGTALLSVLLALGPVLDYGQGFAFRYSQQMTTLGLFRLISPGEALGLLPFSRTAAALSALDRGLQWLGLGLCALLLLAALWRSRLRWLWLSLILPGALYLAWLAGWFWPAARALQQRGLLGAALAERFKPYPYAYMKGAVLVAPLLLGLLMEGWDRLWAWLVRPASGTRRRLAQAALLALFLVPLLLFLRADALVLAPYWERPAHFGRAALQVEEAAALLPPGASVYLTGRPERSRVQLGLFAYFLRAHPVYGRLSLAYGAQDRRVPGLAPAYALLDGADDPHPLGFFPQERIWAGGGMALYRRDPAIVAFLDLRADAYSGRPAAEIHAREPLAERLLQSYGPYPTLEPGRSLVFYADGAGLGRQPGELADQAGRRSLLLALAAPEPTRLSVRWEDGTTETVDLPAGFSLYGSDPRELPGRVQVSLQAEGPLWPCWVALQQGSAPGGLWPQPQEVLLAPDTSVEGTVLEIDLRLQNDSGRPLRLGLEVWEDTFHGAQHYAWWGPLALPDRGSLRLRADLEARSAQAWVEGEERAFPAGAETWSALPPGSYFAALWVYYGQEIVAVRPLAHFQWEDGAVRDLTALDLSAALLWPHSPAQPSGARFGPGLELTAYELGAGPFEPGDRVPLALEWGALDPLPLDYFVTAQIVGPDRLWGQWDGPLGQWYPATLWQPGQHIRDDIPLQVDAEAPPGRYRLIVAVYDPVTMQRLPVFSAAGESLGDSLDLGALWVR
ncbi:MAG: hypothetical protein JXA37_07870 [Chloroflexia bacterium]|nr:hypothetical protein [Chloroflexia bacterium]